MIAADWKEIEIVRRGKRVKGRYVVTDDTFVTVTAWSGTKTARLGILPAERLAAMILRDLVSQEEDK